MQEWQLLANAVDLIEVKRGQENALLLVQLIHYSAPGIGHNRVSSLLSPIVAICNAATLIAVISWPSDPSIHAHYYLSL